MKALEQFFGSLEKIVDDLFVQGYIGWIGVVILAGFGLYLLFRLIFAQ